jgi:plastocyanin
MVRPLPSAAVLVLAVLAAAGAALSATALQVRADPKGALVFDKKTLAAKAGKVTIRMANPSLLPHDVAIKKGKRGKILGKKGKVVLKGGTSVATAVLAKGVYVFFCTVPGHEAGGMWGTLVVR